MIISIKDLSQLPAPSLKAGVLAVAVTVSALSLSEWGSFSPPAIYT